MMDDASQQRQRFQQFRLFPDSVAGREKERRDLTGHRRGLRKTQRGDERPRDEEDTPLRCNLLFLLSAFFHPVASKITQKYTSQKIVFSSEINSGIVQSSSETVESAHHQRRPRCNSFNKQSNTIDTKSQRILGKILGKILQISLN